MTVPPEGRLAGIDFGTVRIGIAISDPGQSFSSPYENYSRQDAQRDEQHFCNFVMEESIVGFVVGLPLYPSGDESPKSLEAREFGAWLARITGRPVIFHDERYTSSAAEDELMAAKLTRKRRKERLDMLAAQIILRSFLDSQSR